MRKGKKYVPRLCICCLPTDMGEGFDRNGRLWRWEFSEMFGPLFVDKRGGPLKVQPMDERHPAWVPFEEWLTARMTGKLTGTPTS